MSNESKQTLIYILYHLSKSDGGRDSSEIMFINEICKNLNLSKEEIDKSISESDFQLNVPKSENDRIFIFFHALQLVEMDKKIVSSEIDMLKRIGLKLGLSPLLVSDLITLSISYLGQKIPSDKIPSILKKYLN